MNLNSEVFFYAFGNKHDSIINMFNLIKHQLNGDLSNTLDIDEVEYILKLLYATLVEKNIKDRIYFDFLFEFSILVKKWIIMLNKYDEFRFLYNLADKICEFITRSFTCLNLIEFLNILTSKSKVLVSKRIPAFDLSEHYYKLLKSE